MKIIDLKENPIKDSSAKNGFDSVSKGLVNLFTNYPDVTATPHCKVHKAMNKVSESGIWRYLACNVGAFQIN